MQFCEANMEVMSPPSNFPLLGAEYIDDDSPFYDDAYVNGAVVPFSWEKKPGVPLMLSPNYLENIKEICSHKEAVVMLNPNDPKVKKVCENHEEKAQKPSLLLQSSFQSSPNHLLFPLPKPPAGLQISSTNNMGNASNNVSNISSTFTPPSLSYSSSNTHIHKQRRSSFQAYLNNKQAKNTTFSMNEANIIEDDPFLKAIQACTEPSMKGADQFGTYERKVQENPTKEAKEGFTRIYNHSTSNNGVQKTESFRKLFDEKVLGARAPSSEQLDVDKLLNTKASLSNINGAMVLSTKSQLSKFNHGNNDDKVLSSKAQISKANYGAYDDKVLSSKAQLSKANYGAKVLDTYKAPISKCDGNFNEDKEIGVKVQLRKLIMEREVRGKQERYNGHPAFMVATFHQSPKHKKPITHKPVQAGPHHQRSSSYGCLGCSSADHFDSIIRL